VSLGIDVSLHEGDGLSQNVKAGSHQINVEHTVIPDQAEHSLVKVACFGRNKGNYDPSEGVGLDRSLSLAEREQIVLVSHELERSWHIIGVDDVDQPVARVAIAYFTKLHRIR